MEIFITIIGFENLYQISNLGNVKSLGNNKFRKEKILKTNFEKYGVKSFTQTKEYISKTHATNMKKYGQTSHMKTEFYREMFSGKNSPVWKGGVNDERWERLAPVYKKWRMDVFRRDGFCCQKCLQKAKRIEAHHITNFNVDLENRYILDNGITFCQPCHVLFHRIYKKKNNNLQQVLEFIER